MADAWGASEGSMTFGALAGFRIHAYKPLWRTPLEGCRRETWRNLDAALSEPAWDLPYLASAVLDLGVRSHLRGRRGTAGRTGLRGLAIDLRSIPGHVWVRVDKENVWKSPSLESEIPQAGGRACMQAAGKQPTEGGKEKLVGACRRLREVKDVTGNGRLRSKICCGFDATVLCTSLGSSADMDTCTF